MARPKEYDPETVLTEAMHVFWGTGYFGTNMSQLIEATHLKPGSLYGAFQSKEALFLAALDHYGQRSVESVRRALDGPDSPAEGIRAWIDAVATEVAGQERHGCLLVNTTLELAGRNAAIRDKVSGYLDQIGDLLASRLTQAQKAGEISCNREPGALAAFMLCTIWGLRVLGETGPSKEKVDAVRRQLLVLLET